MWALKMSTLNYEWKRERENKKLKAEKRRGKEKDRQLKRFFIIIRKNIKKEDRQGEIKKKKKIEKREKTEREENWKLRLAEN